ncbi:hypothetical protein L7F22_032304 [Adiantum nelumboides]|nr:hypothetical protein [Adiantum nelumboides]
MGDDGLNGKGLEEECKEGVYKYRLCRLGKVSIEYGELKDEDEPKEPPPLRQAADYSIFSRSRLAIVCLVFVLATPLEVAEGGPPLPQNFSFASFDNPSAAQVIFVKQNSSWYVGQLNSPQAGSDSIRLTPDPSDVQTNKIVNIGKMRYKDPIICRSPQYGTASFSTSFTLKITTTQEHPNCGSGMAFFIANYDKIPEGSYGRYLGMVSPTTLDAAHRFFAVEFDTHQTTEFSDVSARHIAINVNSLLSLAVADTSTNSTNPQYYPRLFLYNNYTFTAWIEYNSSTNLIQVWATNSSTSQRPSTTCVNLTYNLFDVFSNINVLLHPLLEIGLQENTHSLEKPKEAQGTQH